MIRGIELIPPNTKINFLRPRLWFLGVTALVLLLAAGSVIWPGLNFGVDFRGGIVMEVRMPEPADLGAMRAKLGQIGLGEVSLQQFGGPADVMIRVQRQEGDEGEQIKAINSVKAALGDTVDYRRTEFVGPKVGGELIRAGIISIVLSLLGIMVYIWFRFEWQFGVGAVASLVHDVIATVGLFGVLQLEFNLTSVAAILLIAGYSVNDTVVIYDRVRYLMRRHKTMPLEELINLAMNQTLSRTIITHCTTLLSLTALFIFGGPVIREFVFAMLFGVVVGTYSSIYIASALLLYVPPRRYSRNEVMEAPAQ